MYVWYTYIGRHSRAHLGTAASAFLKTASSASVPNSGDAGTSKVTKFVHKIRLLIQKEMMEGKNFLLRTHKDRVSRSTALLRNLHIRRMTFDIYKGTEIVIISKSVDPIS